MTHSGTGAHVLQRGASGGVADIHVSFVFFARRFCTFNWKHNRKCKVLEQNPECCGITLLSYR
jgi:hypothetical protein